MAGETQELAREQIKAARDLLGMSQAELCAAASIPLITLRRLEGRSDHTGLVAHKTVVHLRRVLEQMGIQFLAPGQTAEGNGVAKRNHP